MDRYSDFKFAVSQAISTPLSRRRTLTSSRASAPRSRRANGSRSAGLGRARLQSALGRKPLPPVSLRPAYFKRTFGRRSSIFWNPDVFGYDGFDHRTAPSVWPERYWVTIRRLSPGRAPGRRHDQLGNFQTVSGENYSGINKAGMSRFLTQKLSWNRFTSPPHHSFR